MVMRESIPRQVDKKFWVPGEKGKGPGALKEERKNVFFYIP